MDIKKHKDRTDLVGEHKIGDEYRDYMKEVPRWLPKISRIFNHIH